jgi:hypothetical protein
MTKSLKLARPPGPFLVLVLDPDGRLAIQGANGKSIPLRDFNPRQTLEARLASQAQTAKTISAIAAQAPQPKAPAPKPKPLAKTAPPLTSWRSLGGGIQVRQIPPGLSGKQFAALMPAAMPLPMPVNSSQIDF